MTDDYKNLLIKYLTGKLLHQIGNNVPQFEETIKEINNNLYSNLVAEFGATIYVNGILQGLNNNSSSIFNVLYGNNGTNGFIVILDPEFNIIQILSQFSSGTPFNIFYRMCVGDDGNFYAIDNNSGTKRFLMLNNIIVKSPTSTNYSVILRKSYNLAANISGANSYTKIIKSAGKSNFLIVGTILVSTLPQPIATELKVNVGAPNEWNEYRYSGSVNYQCNDAYANWDVSDNLTFKIGGLELKSSDSNYYYVEFTSNPDLSLTRVQYSPALGTSGDYSSSVFIGMNTAYFAYRNVDTVNSYLNYYIYKVTSGNVNMNLIYSSLNNSYSGSENLNVAKIYLYSILNEAFFELIFPSISYDYNSRIGKIIDTNVYTMVLDAFNSEDVSNVIFFYVQKQFNLYTYFSQVTNRAVYAYQIYNEFNYNGLPYENENSLIPDTIQLYDSLNNKIFARNINNLTISNNVSLATAEIPNTYLNDVIIQRKNLIGETNKILISDLTSFTKNIFETVILNYMNTITMQDSNNLDNIVQNLAGAIKINQAINTIGDYENTKALKYRKNYTDNTFDILDISGVSLGTTTAFINIFAYIPIDKTIDTIQILSNDESTVYLTINMLGQASNKIYKITQKVEVL